MGVRDNYSSKRFKGDMNPALYIKIPDLTSFINLHIHNPLPPKGEGLCNTSTVTRAHNCRIAKFWLVASVDLY